MNADELLKQINELIIETLIYLEKEDTLRNHPRTCGCEVCLLWRSWSKKNSEINKHLGIGWPN